MRVGEEKEKLKENEYKGWKDESHQDEPRCGTTSQTAS